MWNLFNQHNDGKKVDLKKSVYCGDAAGRKDGKRKDFSDSDYKFALNIEITFQTPEEYFLDQKQKIPEPAWDPKK